MDEVEKMYTGRKTAPKFQSEKKNIGNRKGNMAQQPFPLKLETINK